MNSKILNFLIIFLMIFGVCYFSIKVRIEDSLRAKIAEQYEVNVEANLSDSNNYSVVE